MKHKLIVTGALVAALAAMPLAPAEAGWYHHNNGGLLFGLFAGAAAITGAAVAIATAPINAVAAIGEPEAMPAPVYVAAAPAPVVYGGYAPVVYPARHFFYAHPYGYARPYGYPRYAYR